MSPRSTSRSRFEYLYETLRNRICLLDYPPGMRLSEDMLAQEFGISRTPLRRVLGWLEANGLLKSVQGVGTIVTDIDIDALAQVYELRMELAELIGNLRPVPPNEATLALFQDIHLRSQQIALDPSPRVFAELNMDFFHALSRLSDNEPFREITERLYYQTARIWVKSISPDNFKSEVEIFSREIADIRAAVELGDLSSVGHIRRSHIAMSFARLRQVNSQDDSSNSSVVA